MRWIPFLVLAYLAVVLHTSLGDVLSVPFQSWLILRVDLLAGLAVMITLRVRTRADAMLAAWVLGLLADLTTIGTPIGLWAACFTLGSVAVYQVREAVFSGNPLTQFVMALMFCLLAHGLCVLFDNLYVRASAAGLWRDLLAVLMISLCTAGLTPVLCRLLRGLEKTIMIQPLRRR